jgi:pilus assembly protein CpaB
MDVVLTLVAMAAGVSGAVFVSRYVTARAIAAESALQQRYAPRTVVVAAQDLPKGQRLDSHMLALRQMPSDFVPLDAVSADRAAALVGGRVAIDIKRGTPVMPAALRSGDGMARLSELLPAGRRALTIAVDQVNALAGHLSAGDMIDLFYSQADGAGAMLLPLLQHISVLAVGETLANPDATATASGAGFSSITLLLTADEAARVVLAQETGRITVVLRAGQDDGPTTVATRSSRALLDQPVQRRSGSGAASDQVELLVGGNGGLAPTRSWLPVGLRHSNAIKGRS